MFLFQRLARFFSELKRRRVFRVVGVYLAGGYAVAEAADLFFPRLGLADWTLTAVLVLVVAGFPVAAVLAWTFDIREDPGEGSGVPPVPRTSSWVAVGAVSAVAAVAFGGAALFILESRPPPLDDSRVVVAAFENRTGAPSLETVGALAADWISDGLARSRMVEVVPSATAYAWSVGLADETRGLDPLERSQVLARETGAGILVWGSFYRFGDRIQLQAQVFHVSDRELLRTLQPVEAAVDSVAGAVASLSDRVAGALAARLNPRLAGWADHVRPPGLEAYRAYNQGLERYVSSLDDRGYSEAARLFGRAVELDSTFVVASLWHAQALTNGVDRERADSIVHLLQERPEDLTPYDRAFLDRLEARLHGDWPSAYESAKRMTEIAPASDDAWRERALDALRLNRPNEALEILERLDPRQGWLRGWPHYYYWQAEANHLLGNHERELDVLGEARRHYPEVQWLEGSEGAARAALGRVPPVDSLFTDLASSASPWGPLILALELQAHGHDEIADHALRAASAWHRRYARTNPTVTARRYLLQALYYAGEHDEALEVASGLDVEEASIAGAVKLGVQGAIAARRGMESEALELSRRLAELPPVATGVRHTYWRARIAALLDDRDRAVELIEQAFDEGFMPIRSTSGGLFAPLHVAPEFASLRGYRPFDRLVRFGD